VEDVIAQEGENDAQYADSHEDDLADEDEGTLSWLVYWIDVVSDIEVVLQTVPAELVTTGTGHMWTSRCFLDGNLTFGAFVCQKQKVNKTYKSFEIPTCRRDEYRIAFRTFLFNFCPPLALLHCEDVVTAFGRTFLNIGSKRRVFFEEPFLELIYVFELKRVEGYADIDWVLALEGRKHLAPSFIGYFGDWSFDMLIPAVVANHWRRKEIYFGCGDI
jgi:hypothetical protein